MRLVLVLLFFLSLTGKLQAQYIGGSGKGDIMNEVTGTDLGILIYSGGNGKGDQQLVINDVLLNGTFLADLPIYYGGTGKGDIMNEVTGTDLGILIYGGGNGKGDATITSTTETMSNFWRGSVSNLWNITGNWTRNSIPASGDDIVFDNAAVNHLTADGAKTIGNINFSNSGKNVVLSNFDVTVNGTATGAGASSYFQTNGTGSLKRLSILNAETYTFPVGNSTYNPVTITNNTGTADDFSVRVQDAVLMEATTDTSVNYPMVNRTWHIDKTTPSANAGGGVNFVFQWDTTQQVNDITTFALNHYNGTDWHFAADSGGTQSVSGVNPKQLTFTGYKGRFSPFAIGYDYGPLPVSWKEVRTECTTDNNVMIHWSTATEINNDYFTVERSADGRNWEAVGNMPGNGTTSQEHTYTFTDPQKQSTAAAYYRIKQTDYNGAFAYSSVVVANCRAEQAVRLYPNPAQQWAVLDGVAEGTEWTMYAASGQPVAKGRCESSRCILNTANIPAGSYVLQAGSRRMPLVVMP